MATESVTRTGKPWQWRSLPLNNRTASEVFAALFLDESIATLLESPGAIADLEQSQLSRFSVCAGSPRVSLSGQSQLWTPQTGEILPFLRSLLEQQSESIDEDKVGHLPFTGGWLGWLGYDLAWEIEQLPELNKDTLPFPVAYWYEPECFAVLDRAAQVIMVSGR